MRIKTTKYILIVNSLYSIVYSFIPKRKWSNVKTLSAMDVLAPTTMKNAAKCDTSCELQTLVSHQNFERNLHFRLRGSMSVGVSVHPHTFYPFMRFVLPWTTKLRQPLLDHIRKKQDLQELRCNTPRTRPCSVRVRRARRSSYSIWSYWVRTAYLFLF